MVNIQNKKSGFTLVETFVAITILLIAVLIPLSVLSKAISDGLFIKNRVAATYLAQEGMELVINQVQSNILGISLEEGDWLDGLRDCVDNECSIDFSNPDYDFKPCPSGSTCGVLQQETEDGLYGVEGDIETIFSRKITIGNIIYDGSSEAVIPVQVEVNWRNKAGDLSDQSLILNDFVYRIIYEY